MKWNLPKQFKDWCRAAGLRPRPGWGDSRKKHRWFYLHGHGREWRINDRYELQCGDTYAEFDRWALCDIRSVPLPPNKAAFAAAVKALLLAHGQEAVPEGNAPGSVWVRSWICRNRQCMDGKSAIQVNHTIDLRHHWCTFCGAKCSFERDVTTVIQERKAA